MSDWPAPIQKKRPASPSPSLTYLPCRAPRRDGTLTCLSDEWIESAVLDLLVEESIATSEDDDSDDPQTAALLDEHLPPRQRTDKAVADRARRGEQAPDLPVRRLLDATPFVITAAELEGLGFPGLAPAAAAVEPPLPPPPPPPPPPPRPEHEVELERAFALGGDALAVSMVTDLGIPWHLTAVQVQVMLQQSGVRNVSLATLERLRELNRAQVALAARQAALPRSTAVARPPPRPADHAGMLDPMEVDDAAHADASTAVLAGTSAADLLDPAKREVATQAARDLAKMRIEGRGGRVEGGGGSAQEQPKR